MVADNGETPGTGAYQPVNLPEALAVEVDAAGRPTALKSRRRQPIAAIEDCWRIDDEWWRSEAVSRVYYAVRLSSGRRLVVFRYLNGDRWYRQSY